MANYIIVEGPDGAGKTTLIEELLKSYPGAISKHFGHIPNPDEYWSIYAEAIEENNNKTVVIFDRSWYSDMVYGPVMRNKLEMSPIHARMLDALVVANGGGMIIYCTAKTDILWKRCKARGETYITSIEQLNAISQTYEDVMDLAKLPVIRYNTGR